MAQLRFGTALGTVLAFLMPVAAHAQSAWDWTGAYAGVTAGVIDTGSTVDFSSGTDTTFDTNGRLLGLTAGYNYQIGTIVLGVEADASKAWLDSSGNYQEGLDSLLTLRGRLGVANENIFAYATAGIGGGEANFSTYRDEGYNTTPAAATGSGFVSGPVLGAGVEVALNDNLTIKTEGLMYKFGTLSGTGDNGYGPYDATYTPSGFVLRTGANLHF